MKKDWWLYVVAAVAGAAAWIAIIKLTGRKEAWDSELYFVAAMPAVCLASLVLGLIEPKNAWRWGVVPFAAQFLVMMVYPGPGSLMPLGAIVFGVLSLPAVGLALAGAFIRRRFFPSGSDKE